MTKYKISIRGYGGEVTIGTVTEEEKAVLSNPNKDIYELVNEDLEEVSGSWSEIDDQFHCFGATSPFTITIEDEEGNELFKLDDDDKFKYDTDDFELFETESPEIDATKDLLICYSGEKGSFFLGYVELEGEFDITKLKIIISDVEVNDEFYYGEIISNILYDGEELDNWGGDTDGKSFEVYKNF
jgi:hypothetical protein